MICPSHCLTTKLGVIVHKVCHQGWIDTYLAPRANMVIAPPPLSTGIQGKNGYCAPSASVIMGNGIYR